MITLRYKCKCMQDEGSLSMEQRGKEEDVLVFMDRVREAVGTDHRSRNPMCVEWKVEYVKVPFNPVLGIVGEEKPR